jgi:hypothetical protein
MIELRWVKQTNPMMDCPPTLQYRHKTDPASNWSDWLDVPLYYIPYPGPAQ